MRCANFLTYFFPCTTKYALAVERAARKGRPAHPVSRGFCITRKKSLLRRNLLTHSPMIVSFWDGWQESLLAIIVLFENKQPAL